MSAPADAFWEVSRCMGAFVRSNGPQASTYVGLHVVAWHRDLAPKDARHFHLPLRPSLALEGATRMRLPSKVLLYAGEQDTITQKPCDGMCRKDTFPRAVACASRSHHPGRGRFSPSLISCIAVAYVV
jgi:hypothetical protein